MGGKIFFNPIRVGGAESARPFFRWLFLHEKRGLEVPNFVTFPKGRVQKKSDIYHFGF